MSGLLGKDEIEKLALCKLKKILEEEKMNKIDEINHLEIKNSVLQLDFKVSKEVGDLEKDLPSCIEENKKRIKTLRSQVITIENKLKHIQNIK